MQVVIDCQPDALRPGALDRVGGMTVLERHVREAKREGHEVAVRGPDAVAAIAAEHGADYLSESAPIAAGATVIAGNVLLGIEIRDAKSRKQAEWKLIQTCRRSYDGPADRFIIRGFSLRVTRVLCKLPITPNVVTLMSFLTGMASALMVASGRMNLLPWAGLALFIAVILDSVDGELARIRHMGSARGMILDNVADDVLDNAYAACLGIGLGGPYLWLGLGCAAGRGITAIVTYVEVARMGKPGDVMAFRWWFEAGQETEGVYQNLTDPLTLIRSLGRRDTYVLVFAASLALSAPRVAFGLAAVNSAVYLCLILLHLALSRRDA